MSEHSFFVGNRENGGLFEVVVGWDEREYFQSHRLDGQFAQALRNVLAILKEDAAGPEHIVRLTVYVTDIEEYLSLRDELGPIWKSIMGSNYFHKSGKPDGLTIVGTSSSTLVAQLREQSLSRGPGTDRT